MPLDPYAQLLREAKVSETRVDRQYFVYILTNAKNTVLYVGVTNDLVRRVQAGSRTEPMRRANDGWMDLSSDF